jgi:predicted ATPase
VPLTPLFGRTPDIARLASLCRPKPLADGLATTEVDPAPSRWHSEDDPLFPTRLITLTGPGGCGKTRLALAAAANLRDVFGERIAFVSLAEVTEASRLLETIAQAIGRDRSATGLPQERILTTVGDRPFLLILDRFEHLIDGAEAVRSVLEHAPALVCIVTSCRQLDLDGERVFPVVPLAVPALETDPALLPTFAGVRLFIHRAQAVSPSFLLTPQNALAVSTLCRRLDGLPLAIELAAAWVQALSPQQIVERLTDRFSLLVSRKQGVTPRHRSLEATIESSYALLPEHLQRTFTALSIFRDGWTLESAEQVCAETGGAEMLERLLQLQSRSLVLTQETKWGLRFGMLESLREYGARRLDAATRTAHAEAHAVYFLSRCEQATLRLSEFGTITPAQSHRQEAEPAWRRQLQEEDQANCVAALAWYQSHPPTSRTARRMAEAMRRLWPEDSLSLDVS